MLKYKLRCEKLNFNCRQTKKIVDVSHSYYIWVLLSSSLFSKMFNDDNIICLGRMDVH